jgi:hypothetical protein
VAVKFEELREIEVQWIQEQTEAAVDFVEKYSPGDAGEPLTLDSLDRAFSVWLISESPDTDEVNAVINAVGIAFGSFLVRDAGYSWTMATDEHGCEMAVIALPGQADALVYPANFVAKRWERREGSFMAASFAKIDEITKNIAERLQQTAEGDGGEKKPPWWKRIFKGV